ESDRCRDILASLSHSPRNADDNPFAEVPISVIAELAAMPHQQNDISVTIEKYPTLRNLDNHKDQALEPNVTRSPELLHGLSTLVQNAIQFARNTVEITISWDAANVAVEIDDDGPGFPLTLLDRLGEPYLSTRSREKDHMGLGIFISKTLLGRTHAQLFFKNRPDGGASVLVKWDRKTIEAENI
ncbi:MAG: ATP-binding protein, partial [Pseudomonadota bacterium]|nr:ATP-binding protein [Pseudomonadota bacterium]